MRLPLMIVTAFVFTVLSWFTSSTAWAISASCSAFPSELTRVEGEPGAISLAFNYSNDSNSTVTFTTTTFSSAFGSGSESMLAVAPDVGAAQNPAVQTFALPSGQDTIRIEITSDATGATALAGCDYTLTILPTGADTDNDGLLDAWETSGVDVDLDGTSDIFLPGAVVGRKDLYLEVDCMVKDGDGNGTLGDATDHSHCPLEDAIVDAVQAYADAPVANSDGTTGVQLHVDTGPLFGAGSVIEVSGIGGVVGTYGDLGGGGDMIDETGNEIIDWDGAAGNPGTSYYDLKDANFDSRRMFVYRYGLFGHQTNARRATNDCTTGVAEGIPSNDFFVTLGGTNTNGDPCWQADVNGFSVGSRAQQAGTLMHELGHTLGLRHGGGDGVNRKPNYLSVMNYAFQSCNVPASPAGMLPGGCDYSPNDLADLDETSLDECAGIGGGLGFGSMDWDSDMTLEGVTCLQPDNVNVSSDINDDDTCVTAGDNGVLDSVPEGDDMVEGTKIVDGADFTCNSTVMGDDVQAKAVGNSQPNLLESFDDWSNIVYPFRTLEVFAAGEADPVQDEPDPTVLKEASELLSRRLEPVLLLEKSGPNTALPGETLTFELLVRNEGMGPALNVLLTDTLPDASVQEFNLEALTVGQEVVKRIGFTVPEDACPEELMNSVSADYEDFVGKALTTDDSVQVVVLDVVPPVLEVAVSPNTLWPPNHKLVEIEAWVVATDECDPDPEIRLVSITSNEPDNGGGDGDTSGDVHGADFGAHDTSFVVRAERSGRGAGRIYTVTYEAEDNSGNVSTAAATILVPLSRRSD